MLIALSLGSGQHCLQDPTGLLLFAVQVRLIVGKTIERKCYYSKASMVPPTSAPKTMPLPPIVLVGSLHYCLLYIELNISIGGPFNDIY